jgi:hypothetical protein
MAKFRPIFLIVRPSSSNGIFTLAEKHFLSTDSTPKHDFPKARKFDNGLASSHLKGGVVRGVNEDIEAGIRKWGETLADLQQLKFFHPRQRVRKCFFPFHFDFPVSSNVFLTRIVLF